MSKAYLSNLTKVWVCWLFHWLLVLASSCSRISEILITTHCHIMIKHIIQTKDCWILLFGTFYQYLHQSWNYWREGGSKVWPLCRPRPPPPPPPFSHPQIETEPSVNTRLLKSWRASLNKRDSYRPPPDVLEESWRGLGEDGGGQSEVHLAQMWVFTSCSSCSWDFYFEPWILWWATHLILSLSVLTFSSPPVPGLSVFFRKCEQLFPGLCCPEGRIYHLTFLVGLCN